MAFKATFSSEFDAIWPRLGVSGVEKWAEPGVSVTYIDKNDRFDALLDNYVIMCNETDLKQMVLVCQVRIWSS